jgi:hypothetical protein
MTDSRTSRMTGLGRVLVFFYGLLALAATGRSVTQILTKYDEAPVAYALSALAAVVYIVATVALVAPARTPGAARRWYRIAFELVGVLVVGTLSLVDAELFPHDSVWSVYGYGYVFIPLVLPVLGLLWLRRGGRSRVSAVDERPVRGDR